VELQNASEVKWLVSLKAFCHYHQMEFNLFTDLAFGWSTWRSINKWGLWLPFVKQQF